MFPSGKYYIGDLSLVMEVDKIPYGQIVNTVNEYVLFEKYPVKTQRHYYTDNFNTDYCIFSGFIGCVLASDIVKDPSTSYYVHEDSDIKFYTFTEPFSTYEQEGVVHFGHLEIDTN